jgi:hypothetical protein
VRKGRLLLDGASRDELLLDGASRDERAASNDVQAGWLRLA